MFQSGLNEIGTFNLDKTHFLMDQVMVELLDFSEKVPLTTLKRLIKQKVSLFDHLYKDV